MPTLARWSFQHRRLVLLLWLAAVLGVGVTGAAAGTDYKNVFSLPGTGSQEAMDLLAREFPAASGDSASIVLHARSGTLRDPQVQATASRMLDSVARLSHVVEITSPYGPDTVGRFSTDGRTAFATVALDRLANEIPRDDIVAIVDTARAADSGALQVELSGNPISVAEQNLGSTSELVGIAAAAVILFIAFGTLLAMTLPLITAIIALGVGLSLIGLLSHAMNIAEFGPTLATLIGLGVGIDYALFIVNRHRTALRAGRSPQDAVVTAINTSGRAVMFAGVTVCIALLGMLALRVDFLVGVAVGAALVVALTMATAVTLLPALFGFFGMKVLSRKERARLAAAGGEPEVATGFWWNWARRIERRPALSAVIAAGLIVVVAVPFFSLRLGSSDQGNGPESKTSRRGYDLLAEGFGAGFNGPFVLAAEIGSPADRGALSRLVATLHDTPGVASVSAPRESPNGRAATVTLYPTTSPQDAETSKLLDRLRDEVIPASTRGSSLVVHVGGVTAIFDDFAHVLADKLPLFVAVVIGLACLLLVVVFRSVVIPLMASVMNLLAVAASFGVLVAIFQWGWLSDLFDIQPGPIEPFLPVMIFAILFGLSMDYEVFLVSRMHEEWLARRDNRIAVSLGQAETGRVISAAGAIMALVFGSFMLGDDRVIKMFGLGLALAVVIDAFVIRTVLVPALMHLCGRANWWLPARLDRVLPTVSVEPTDQGEEIRYTPVPPGAGVPAQAGTAGSAQPGPGGHS
ncbi:MMPL family transporter [Frankia sp. Cr1]|uniref:MMPL family transporter n=1 Tax=Frankia sp. Cr1 TaxID=3073931 RepID=UPI002AD35CF7|nr:MMPL family transporter [Frankia sp. Cr1]